MKRFIWVMGCLFGCAGDGGTDEGTVVGNPGDTKMQMAEPGNGEFIQARTRIQDIVWAGCDGTDQIVEVEENIDLLDDASTSTPAGEWCGVWVSLSEPLVLELFVPDWDKEVLFYLEIEGLFLDTPTAFTTDNENLVFEWGYQNWFVDQQRPLEEWFLEEERWEEEEGVEVTEDDPVYDAVAVVFADASAVYADKDGDGRINEDERNGGPLAAGPDHPQSMESQDEDEQEETVIGDGGNMKEQGQLKVGPGCAASESKLGWGLLFPLVMLGRRRSFSGD
jgi:catechol 2,3-dioxygenase-like lactoylglutathione lyase family enzyme